MLSLLKRFIPTLFQLKKHQLLIDSSLMKMVERVKKIRLNSQTKLCASFLYKSRPRPDKEPGSRLLLQLVIEEDTLELVSRLLRKSKLLLRELFLMLRSILSPLEEVTGVLESVVSIPSHAK